MTKHKIRILEVKPILTEKELEKKEGDYFSESHYKTIIKTDCDIYGILDDDNINNGIDTIKNTLDLNNDSITKNLNESINTLGKTIEVNLNDNINTLGKTIEGNLNESMGSLPEKLSNEIIPKTYGVLDGTLDNIREQMQDLTNSFNNTSKIENPLILETPQPPPLSDGNNIISKIKNLKI